MEEYYKDEDSKNTNYHSEESKEIHKKIKKLIDTDLKAVEENYRIATEMQNFLVLDQHFGADEEYARGQQNKSTVILPVLNQYTNQVVGELLQNKMIPEAFRNDKKASAVTAKIIEGHVREILYGNNAEGILDQAGIGAIESGLGAVSLDLVYSQDNPFDLEVKLKSEPDFTSIIPDAMSEEPDWSDGEHITKFFVKTKEDFKKEYPDCPLPSQNEFDSYVGTSFEPWYKDNTVTLAKHYTIVKETEKYVKLSDGTECTEEEGKEKIAEFRAKKKEEQGLKELGQLEPILARGMSAPSSPPVNSPSQGSPMGQTAPSPLQGGMSQGMPQMPPQGQGQQAGVGAPIGNAPTQENAAPPIEPYEEEDLKIIDERDVETKTVKCYILTGHYLLSGPEDFNSSYLPYVFDFGKVRFVGKKRVIQGLANKAKKGQKLVDQFASEISDAMDRRVKAQYFYTPQMIAGHEKEWADANVGDSAGLPVNPGEDGNIQMPIPINAPAPVAEIQQLGNALEMIKASIGMNNVDVGAPSNEASGLAITRKQTAGDVNVYEFLDNHKKFVQRLATILVDMICKNYDGERELLVRELDDNEHRAVVNIKAGKALQLVKKDPEYYSQMDVKDIEDFIRENGSEAEYASLKDGKYKVRVKAGLPYATARQENADSMQSYLQTVGLQPDQTALEEKYFFSKLLDSTEEYSDIKRMKLLAAGIIEPNEDEKEKVQKWSERQKQMMEANPQFQIQKMKLQTEQGKIEVEKLKLQTEQLKIQGAGAKAQKQGIELQKEISGTPNEMAKMMLELMPQVIQMYMQQQMGQMGGTE